ncbi:DUF1467 family protein [Pseudoroseicyclus aestuarii]|uniref:Putative secreted protein n=1 Tax=Pseudoroseicyclus aestuarii TaxID=1795041 RepID=A0A318SR17_9RHOB|nr:DUF1467 family protein [Pseudoroseicyclus aestuarii]PYE84113.1 putative secreted protein [Pseudoroseicyclus aestuarii]
MSITAAAVLFAVCWFMVFFIVLPLNLTTQGDAGTRVPGTHVSSPEDLRLGRKMIVTTLIALLVWAGLAFVITSGWIEIRDFDWFGVLDRHLETTGQSSIAQ